jgi:hypothetical protein
VRQASGVGRRASGVGRRASGVGRRASGVGRRASGVGRRAAGDGRRERVAGRRWWGAPMSPMMQISRVAGRRASSPTAEVGDPHSPPRKPTSLHHWPPPGWVMMQPAGQRPAVAALPTSHRNRLTSPRGDAPRRQRIRATAITLSRLCDTRAPPQLPKYAMSAKPAARSSASISVAVRSRRECRFRPRSVPRRHCSRS